MALVMVQGHVFDSLVSPADRAHSLYQFQVMFHGSTAPGFLFASGLVAGLPRAPLSWRATFRRARRLLFVLGVGYALHLPYFSLWKTADSATEAERALLYACHPLQLIAVTQLAVLVLQWLFGQRWAAVSTAAAAIIVAATPVVWASGFSRQLPLPVSGYVDPAIAPSPFPIFPFAAFVFAGTAAGAALGRQDPARRRRRALAWGAALIAAGVVLAVVLAGRVDFWTTSPGYALMRLGGLLLILFAAERAADRGLAGTKPLALLGHETLLVYVLHLAVLFGGVVAASPLLAWHGRLGFGMAALVLVLMVPGLYVAARAWHAVKVAAPHAASLTLVFLSTWFVWEFLTRPW